MRPRARFGGPETFLAPVPAEPRVRIMCSTETMAIGTRPLIAEDPFQTGAHTSARFLRRAGVPSGLNRWQDLRPGQGPDWESRSDPPVGSATPRRCGQLPPVQPVNPSARRRSMISAPMRVCSAVGSELINSIASRSELASATLSSAA